MTVDTPDIGSAEPTSPTRSTSGVRPVHPVYVSHSGGAHHRPPRATRTLGGDAGFMLLAVGVAATATLGFWLAASGDVIGAVLIAAGVLALAAPAGACLATPPLVIRAEQRASQLGLGLDRPDSWRRLGSADTVVVRQPEDPLRPAVLGAFRALDALGLRTVLVLDETPDATGLDDHALVVPEVDGVVDLWAAVDAVRLVRRVRRLIRQNLLLAGAVILLALPFAASGWLRPSVVAAVAATAVALVVLNSCRIHRFRSQRPPAHRHR